MRLSKTPTWWVSPLPALMSASRLASIAGATVSTRSSKIATSPSATVWTDVVHGTNGASITDADGQFEVRVPITGDSLFLRLVATAPSN